MIAALAGSMILSLLFVHLAATRLLRKASRLFDDNQQLAQLISLKLDEHHFGSTMLKEKLLSPSVYAGLLPQIEVHVDHFLNVKLKEQMPVVGMLVGERTIAQMKGIFLNELELLFPEVMDGYLSALEKDDALKKQMTEKLIRLASDLVAVMPAILWKKSAPKVYGLAMLAGLVISLFNIGLYFLVKP